jgi:hypothetical protein
MKRFSALTLLMATSLAHASGPVAPDGWDGSYAAVLPNGQPCCIPADLNGTGLIGGAFTLISNNQEEFGLFALTYTPPLEPHWQLLERHPVSLLPAYRVSVEPAGNIPNPSIKACVGPTHCTQYVALSAIEHLEPVAADER